MHSVPSVKNAL